MQICTGLSVYMEGVWTCNGLVDMDVDERVRDTQCVCKCVLARECVQWECVLGECVKMHTRRCVDM